MPSSLMVKRARMLPASPRGRRRLSHLSRPRTNQAVAAPNRHFSTPPKDRQLTHPSQSELMAKTVKRTKSNIKYCLTAKYPPQPFHLHPYQPQSPHEELPQHSTNTVLPNYSLSFNELLSIRSLFLMLFTHSRKSAVSVFIVRRHNGMFTGPAGVYCPGGMDTYTFLFISTSLHQKLSVSFFRWFAYVDNYFWLYIRKVYGQKVPPGFAYLKCLTCNMCVSSCPPSFFYWACLMVAVRLGNDWARRKEKAGWMGVYFLCFILLCTTTGKGERIGLL